MITAALVIFGLVSAVLLGLWLMTFIRYRITRHHLRISLFGIPLRLVRLDGIESVSKRRQSGWTEHWWNTLRPNHRLLVIRRNRGLAKNIVITPRHRYVFRTSLERAIQRAGIPGQHAEDDATLSAESD